MAKDIETYLKDLQAALAASGADSALVQDALFDAEEHMQAEMAVGGVVGRGTATYEERFAGVVEGYGTPEEVAAAYMGTAPSHEVVAVYELALANGAAEPASEAAGVSEVAGEVAAGEVVAGAEAEAGTEIPAEAVSAIGTEAAGATPRFCRDCGRELHPGAEFCTGCGAPVAAPVLAAEAGAQAAAPEATEAPLGPSPPYAPGAPAPSYAPAPAGVQAGMAAATARSAGPPSVWDRVFGVFADPAVWKALVYMILSLGTGVAYFTIVVTGVSTAGGMLILIIGIPLFVAVLGLVRAMALLEGRIVEVLLGTRMPRRPRATPPGMNILERMWFWVRDGRTWASMVYMLLMLPLGVAYFTIAVTGLTTGLALVTAPIWGWFADGTIVIEGVTYDWWFPTWGIPLALIGGVIVLVGMMHLIRWIGRGHAAFAKAMLVRLTK